MSKKYPFIASEKSITVIIDNLPKTIDASHPNFAAVSKALMSKDHSEIPNLVEVQKAMQSFCGKAIEIKNDSFFYKGVRIENVVANKIMELLKAGAEDVSPLTNFLEKLLLNPSKRSVEQLYSFIERNGMTIDADGCIIAYKGVDTDDYSCHGNTQTIVLQGVVDDAGRIRNQVGDVLEVARNNVCDNPDVHCSAGLHVCSINYGFGTKQKLVKVNPTDVVSVPRDCNCEKMRVCKYEVIADIGNVRKEIKPFAYSFSQDEVDDGSAFDDGDDDGVEFYNADALRISAYIGRKLDEGESVSMKQIQSRMKGSGLTCADILEIVENFGYDVTKDGDYVSAWYVE